MGNNVIQAAEAEAEAEAAERERAKALEWLQGQLLAGGWGADGVMPVRGTNQLCSRWSNPGV